MIQFGSSSNKQSANQSSSFYPVKIDTWTPEHWTAFRSLMPALTQGATGPATAYPGMMYTPRTAEEQKYFDYTLGDASTRPEAIDRAFTGRSAYDINPETTEQLYQSGVRAPALREYQEITLPSIREAYTGPGYYGTRRMEAEARAGENLATTLAQKRAELMYADEQAKRTLATEGANRAIQYGVPQMGTAGAMARTIENERVAADLQRWLAGEAVDGKSNAAYNPYIQLVMQMMGMNPYAIAQSGMSTGSSSGSGSSWGLGLTWGK